MLHFPFSWHSKSWLQKHKQANFVMLSCVPFIVYEHNCMNSFPWDLAFFNDGASSCGYMFWRVLRKVSRQMPKCCSFPSCTIHQHEAVKHTIAVINLAYLGKMPNWARHSVMPSAWSIQRNQRSDVHSLNQRWQPTSYWCDSWSLLLTLNVSPLNKLIMLQVTIRWICVSSNL